MTGRVVEGTFYGNVPAFRAICATNWICGIACKLLAMRVLIVGPRKCQWKATTIKAKANVICAVQSSLDVPFSRVETTITVSGIHHSDNTQKRNKAQAHHVFQHRHCQFSPHCLYLRLDVEPQG